MLKLAGKIILSSFEARLARFFNSFVEPRFINFITTYKCNSRCLTCNIWNRYQQDNSGLKDELTLSEINDFFLNNKKYFSKLIGIGFTGGEFTLRDDAVGIVKFLKENFPGVILGFQTNGLYPEKLKALLKDMLKFDPDLNIAVSIDGPAEIHDRIRGVPGAFDQAILSIRYARELGVARITSGMTINPLNFSYIPEVYRVCQDMGTVFSCFLAETSGYFYNEGRSYQLDERQRKRVLGDLKGFGYDYFMDNLRLQLEHKRKISLPCYSGYTSLVIDPYGNIKPCILIDKSFGNIKTDKDLRAAILKKSTRQIRQGLKDCHCWCQCEVSCSAFVDPIDVACWFLFYCRDKRGFLKKTFQRWQ